MHAPLLDPGGAPSTRQSASGTAAFQCLETVGFPPRYTFRGSITRPASSLPPAPYAHCWVCTWRLLLTCWLDFSQGGLALRSAHLLGNINQFPRIAPIPKVSGLPWRDQALVRCCAGPGLRRRTSFSPDLAHLSCVRRPPPMLPPPSAFSSVRKRQSAPWARLRARATSGRR
jgi:hypothetical protein